MIHSIPGKQVLASAWLVGAGLIVAACADNGPTGPDYNPEIPTAWATAVTNSYFPLEPGTTYTYEGETEDGTESIVVEVLNETRMVNGVEAAVVRDRVYVDGALVEDTYDWYAQDTAGNVWYLGEDSKEIEDGEVVSTDGSWQWGVDGALPGIIMWADPAAHVGEEYRQEYYQGEAEDWAEVVALNETVETPFDNFTACIRTEDSNALEPGVLENKWYCPEIGFVREVKVEGGEETVALVEVTTS